MKGIHHGVSFRYNKQVQNYSALFIEKVEPKHTVTTPLEKNQKMALLPSLGYLWAHGACTSLILCICYLQAEDNLINHVIFHIFQQ